jgi:hypothetical protein
LIFRLLVAVSILTVSAGCKEMKKVPSNLNMVPNDRVVVYKQADGPGEMPEPAVLSEKEQKRKETAMKLDKCGLLYSSKILVDSDKRMLEIPESLKPYWGENTVVAKTAPTVEFGIIPATPRFFGPVTKKPTDPKVQFSREWSNWSQAAYYEPTGKFYSAIGDTDPYDAHIYLVEYDPATRNLKCWPEINRWLGVPEGQMKEGKIHGYLDFYDGPNLFLCTYWTAYPEPGEAEYQSGYTGGHILSFNVLTGEMNDHGIPANRISWPYNRLDSKRGTMYGVGFFGEFLAYDIKNHKNIWCGYPPKDMTWWWRAMMLDDVTGNVYSTYIYDPDPNVHMLKYDPKKNRFYQLEARMPKCSGKHQVVEKEKPREVDMIRANTLSRGPDGLIWGVTKQGELFTFNPDTEKVEAKGVNWPGLMKYTCSMERSPGGRYLYYVPGAHGMGYKDGTPIVQYDTKTGVKKVLAFLYPYLSEKYGYIASGTFAVKLDSKGENIFCCWNGGFFNETDAFNTAFPGFFGNCAITYIHIPASEREE